MAGENKPAPRKPEKWSYLQRNVCIEGRSVQYTAAEVQVKLHNLTNRYKKEKKLIGPSGGSPSEWPLYMHIHSFLGDFRINNLECIVEDSRSIERNSYSSYTLSSPPGTSTLYVDDALSSLGEISMDSSGPDPRGASTSTNLSPPGSPSTSSRVRARKKRKNNEKPDTGEVDSEMLSLLKQMADTDKENNALMKELVVSTKEFQNGVLDILKQ